MRAHPTGAVGARESRAGGDPALSLPACVLRLPGARPVLCALPRAGRAGQRLSEGTIVEDRRRLRSAALSPAMVGVFLEGVVQIRDRRPSRHRYVSDPAAAHVTRAGSVLLEALCGGLRMFSAF